MGGCGARRLPLRPAKRREALRELLAGPDPVSWAAAWLARDFGPFALAVAVVSVKYAFDGGRDTLIALVAVIGVALVYAVSVRPRLILTDEVMIAINPIGAWACPLDDIESIDPRLHGLRITTTDGSTYAAWAA